MQVLRLVAHGSDYFQYNREKQNFKLKQVTGFGSQMWQVGKSALNQNDKYPPHKKMI